MTELTPIAAFLAGLAGSGHCIGMCGGIAALGVAGKDELAGLRALLYSLGRVGSYAFMGALGATALGLVLDRTGITAASSFARDLIAAMTIAFGLVLVLRESWLAHITAWGSVFWRKVKPLMSRLLPADTWYKSLLLGALWGWLPCGLVYAMLSIAWLSSDSVQGAVIMASFGMGTLPAMVGISLSGASLFPRLFNQSGQRAKMALRLMAGVMLVVSGVTMLAMPRMAPDGDHSHHTQVESI